MKNQKKKDLFIEVSVGCHPLFAISLIWLILILFFFFVSESTALLLKCCKLLQSKMAFLPKAFLNVASLLKVYSNYKFKVKPGLFKGMCFWFICSLFLEGLVSCTSSFCNRNFLMGAKYFSPLFFSVAIICISNLVFTFINCFIN